MNKLFCCGSCNNSKVASTNNNHLNTNRSASFVERIKQIAQSAWETIDQLYDKIGATGYQGLITISVIVLITAAPPVVIIKAILVAEVALFFLLEVSHQLFEKSKKLELLKSIEKEMAKFKNEMVTENLEIAMGKISDFAEVINKLEENVFLKRCGNFYLTGLKIALMLFQNSYNYEVSQGNWTPKGVEDCASLLKRVREQTEKSLNEIHTMMIGPLKA
jgi:hypothetical protein